MNADLSDVLIAGTAGAKAELSAFDTSAGTSRTLAKCQPGHGTYTGSRTNRAALFGNRAGQLLYTDRIKDVICCADAFHVLQPRGPQIIDVHLGEDRKAIVCDMDRVTLWNLASPTEKTVLPTQGQFVIAACLLGDRGFGLSAGGRLLAWDIPTAELADIRHVPPPPKKCALIHLVQHGAWGKLAYPAADGQLALFDPETRTATLVPAHEGDFYALFPSSNGPISAGRHDGAILFWGDAPDVPPLRCQGPRDIVAGASLPGAPARLALVDSQGGLHWGRMESGVFLEENHLPDAACRVVAGPDPATLRRAADQSRKNRIREVLAEIQRLGPQAPPGQLDALCLELSGLGAEEAALEIRSQDARRRAEGNPEAILEELALRRKQAALLPDCPEAIPSLNRYAEALEWTCVYSGALEVWERIERIDGAAGTKTRAEGARRRAEDLRRGKSIIECNVALPFPILGRAHAMHAVPMLGLYAVQMLRSIASGDVSRDPKRLLTKYRGQARIEQIAWRTHEKETSVATFLSEIVTVSSDIRALTVLPMIPGSIQLTPMVALDVGPAGASPDAMRAAFEHLLRGGLDRLIQDQFSRLHEAIGKTANELDAERMKEEGLI